MRMYIIDSRSSRRLISFPRRALLLAYIGVPRRVPVDRKGMWMECYDRYLAERPKSMSVTIPSLEIIMFLGLRSLWMRP